MSAADETEIPSYREVEQIVADEGIDFDTRRGLMLRYLDYVEDEDVTAYGFRDEDHFEDFKERYMSSDTMKISTGDLVWEHSSEGDVEEDYTKAKAAYDRNRDGDRQRDRDAVSDGKGELEAIKGKSSSTEAGAENSNAILDTGVASLRVFDTFIPLYNRALGLVGGGAGAEVAEIYRLYDEQRDIPFGTFKAAEAEFTTVKEAVAESAEDVAGGLKSTLSAWEGAAADQAREYQTGYEKNTDVVERSLGDAGNAVLESSAAVSQHCQGKADWVQRYYFDRLFGEVTADDLDRIMRIVELGSHASQNDFIHCARLIGGEAEAAMNDDSCDLNDDTIRMVQEQARSWLRSPFCSWFEEHISNFTLMCANTRTAVDETWSALAGLLNELPEDPFVAQPDGGGSAQGPLGVPAGATGGGATGGGATGGGAPGGGATGGGGAGGGVPGMPTAPTGEMPKPSGAGALPDVNPLTGKPIELDPESGEPYPIDPETGHAIKDVGGAQETMSVKKGDHEISLTGPGEDGEMGISIDDGKGGPKEYQLDFGGGDEGTPGQGGKSAAATSGGFGPEGTGSAPGGDMVYRPGPDGSILIEDGDLTITAERPDGPEGPTVVTVDDGNGEPTSYTLGDPENAEAAHSGSLPGEAGANPSGGPAHGVGGAQSADPSGPNVDGAEVSESPKTSDGTATSTAGAATGDDGGLADSGGADGSTQPQFVGGAADAVGDSLGRSGGGLGAGAGESTGGVGLGDTSSLEAGKQFGAGAHEVSGSSASLASAPDTPVGGGSGGQQSAGAPMGGMMGGAGGAGAGGGDEQEHNRSYRIDGGLFDTEELAALGAIARISGVIGDDE